MSVFWWIVIIAALAELGTYAVALWWEAIRDLARKIPPSPTKD